MDSEHYLGIISGIANGAIPAKYCYIGDGADLHIRHSRTEAYRSVAGNNTMPIDLISPRKNYKMPCLIDLGPGNGLKTSSVIELLLHNDVEVGEIVLIDINHDILCEAQEQILAKHNRPASLITIDIETEFAKWYKDFRLSSGSGNLICLFGNTLGNFENDQKFVTDLSRSLGLGDEFVFGVSMLENIDQNEHLSGYNTDSFKSGILTPFQYVGIDVQSIEIDTYWDRDDNSVKSVATFLNEFNLQGSTIKKGHKVICFVSRRYTLERIESLIDQGLIEIQFGALENNQLVKLKLRHAHHTF